MLGPDALGRSDVLSFILSTETICSSRFTTRSNSQKTCMDRSTAKANVNPAVEALRLELKRNKPVVPNKREVIVSIKLEKAIHT